MGAKKTLTIIALLFWGMIHAQREGSYTTTFSFFSSLEYSKGFEIRGEFEEWYISFQGESFIQEKKDFLNWGFSIGKFKQLNSFTVFYGGRVSFMNIDKESKPSFGLEAEIDYNISDMVYIALRGSADVYWNSTNYNEPVSYGIVRPFIKLGIKF